MSRPTTSQASPATNATTRKYCHTFSARHHPGTRSSCGATSVRSSVRACGSWLERDRAAWCTAVRHTGCMPMDSPSASACTALATSAD